MSSYDIEVFKDTFQKPCQIYKFLREYWKSSPPYLTRTLRYISNHRDVKPALNRTRKIDSIGRKLLKAHFERKRNKLHDPHQNSNGQQDSLSSSNHRASSVSNGNEISSVKGTKTCYFDWVCSDSNRTSQKTRSYGFLCPWCEKDYHHLDSLMKHLKCCHPRFNFTLQDEDHQPVIEITLNKSFDGSYCGFKYPGHDLRRDFRFTPKLPEHRQPLTQIIYFRSKKRPVYGAFKSNNFWGAHYDDGEADVDVCSGRLYYHTSTCLPIKPNELDTDSEADIDPHWLRERTQLMIDEFTDVNEGEKEILKLWNLHMMERYRYKGDSMIRKACFEFIELNGQTIWDKNLFRNLSLHLSNLYEFGLISSQDLLDCIRMVKKFRPNSPLANSTIITASVIAPTLPNTTTTNTRMSNKLKRELNSNDICQLPPKRALLSSHVNQ